jgi:hypothetical protein
VPSLKPPVLLAISDRCEFAIWRIRYFQKSSVQESRSLVHRLIVSGPIVAWPILITVKQQDCGPKKDESVFWEFLQSAKTDGRFYTLKIDKKIPFLDEIRTKSSKVPDRLREQLVWRHIVD